MSEKVYAKQYNGPSGLEYTDRGITQANKVLVGNFGPDASIDQLVLKGLVRANAAHMPFNLLDIGCGTGRLLEDIATFTDLPQSAEYAGLHAVRINLFGLTDTPAADLHNQPLETAYPSNPRLCLKPLYWSLTRTQGLDRFMDANGIAGINLALGVSSFNYLSPSVFHHTVQTLMKHLVPGGNCTLIGLKPVIPGTEGFLTGFRSNPRNPLSELLSRMNSYETSHLEIDPPVLRQALLTYLRLKAITPDDIQDAFIIENVPYDTGLSIFLTPDSEVNSNQETLCCLAQQLLVPGYNRLIERKTDHLFRQRMQQLNELAGNNPGVTLNFGKNPEYKSSAVIISRSG